MLMPIEAITRTKEIYQKLADSAGISIRDEQLRLSLFLLEGLFSKQVPVAEAPTGTGKTLAYLISGLVYQEFTRIPFVAATATIALQEQIVKHDLPKLYEIKVLNQKDVTLLKGRNRYVCKLSVERFYESVLGNKPQFDMFSDESENNTDIPLIDPKEVRLLLEQLNSEEWDGEVDSLDKKPKFWEAIMASSDTCANRKCPHFETCNFFNTRKKSAFSKAVITNHDLVLSDLELAANEAEPVIPLKNYVLIVDECHHLPNKAAKQGAISVSLDESLSLLEKMPFIVSQLYKSKELADLLASKNLSYESFAFFELPSALKPFFDYVRKDLSDLNPQTRFRSRDYPQELLSLAKQASIPLMLTAFKLSELVTFFNGDKTVVDKFPDSFPHFLSAIGISKAVIKLGQIVESYSYQTNWARWCVKSDKGTFLHISPVEGREKLKKILWSDTGIKRARPAMVSATLCANNSFDNYEHKAALPAYAKYDRFKSSFNYGKSQLVLPNILTSPKDEENYLKEVANRFKEIYTEPEATLLLFNSRKAMQQFTKLIRTEYPYLITQDDRSMADLLKHHTNRVLAGKPALTLGLQKMAEGLDLPGDLCKHVVIFRLPFNTPTDPIEEEKQELYKDLYFTGHVLPETATKLVQMCGRLIRRESDFGRITILDNRLRKMSQMTSYLLNSLPNYTLVKE